MNECWPEGDLRAYLDRELAPDEMERAAGHVAECPECSARCEVLSARAGRVSAWMDALAEPVSPVSRRTGWKWVAAALAAAAVMVIAVAVAPRRASPPVRPARAALGPVARAAEPAASVSEAVVRHERPSRLPARPPVERTENFVALDNEPFEAGWVVRMALGPDQIQADVVFSADGRARAYRLVDSSSN
jgi:Putative zinc-finger